ncbi:methyl-accepting chemotaxis protein [Gynuella sunshinyii]|uniref:Methyl-accepting chemotaxis protein n=1 Tax=Gynuella sunshinyii YC6258 TaxID=1445510 RepID=A0A0C5V341_9GAMM|nr:methyl-accepting chemotaxis protein [Gynuella sunshinyii]AJQ93950.1 methyl-accepting chemotaxis protein [Gynuella sunshinyii YC6258]
MKYLTLSQKLLFGVIVPIILAFGILTTVIGFQLDSSLTSMHEEAASNNVESRSSEISRWLTGYMNWLSSLANSESLRYSMSNEERSDWLKRYVINDPAIDVLLFADRDGMTITQKGPTPLDVSDREYFQELLSGRSRSGIISQPMISKATGHPVSVVAVPVIENNRTIGVLAVALTLEELSKVANQLAANPGAGEFGWVVDADGVAVAHPDKTMRMKLNITKGDQNGFLGMTALSREVLSGRSGIGSYLRPDGEKFVMIFAPIEVSPGWVIGLSVPAKNFTKTTYAILRNIITLMVLAFIALVIVLIGISGMIVKPIRRVVNMLKDIAEGEGDLTQRLPVEGKDEQAQLADGFNRFADRIHQLMLQVARTSEQLNDSAARLQTGCNEMSDNVHKQQSEVDQIAAAMNEMESTVREVASHAQTASTAAQEGNAQAREGSMRVGRVREVIIEQAELIRSSADEVSALQQSGAQIGQVMEVIRGIAEQTNLLALNAAIEAARAGNAGRGFAVVSDEVRQLAGRTHESTQQIQQTVEALQEHISRAVSVMHTSSERSRQSVEEAEAAHEALQAISIAIDNIEGMNLQIAAATEQQGATAAELSRNLEHIVDVSNTTLRHTVNASDNIGQLFAQADELRGVVGRFRL